MDAISMHQSNITNTVAIMNKSMTEFQMTSILNLTKNIRLFLDGDGPGIDGAIVLIPKLYAHGFNVEVIIAKNNSLEFVNETDRKLISSLLYDKILKYGLIKRQWILQP